VRENRTHGSEGGDGESRSRPLSELGPLGVYAATGQGRQMITFITSWAEIPLAHSKWERDRVWHLEVLDVHRLDRIGGLEAENF
jgi:hypothetical protein